MGSILIATHKAPPCAETGHATYPLLHSSPFYPIPNFVPYNAFQFARRPNGAPSVGHQYPRVTHGSVGHPTQHRRLHLDRFSRFCRVHDRDRSHMSTVAMRSNNNSVGVRWFHWSRLFCRGRLTAHRETVS